MKTILRGNPNDDQWRQDNPEEYAALRSLLRMDNCWPLFRADNFIKAKVHPACHGTLRDPKTYVKPAGFEHVPTGTLFPNVDLLAMAELLEEESNGNEDVDLFLEDEPYLEDESNLGGDNGEKKVRIKWGDKFVWMTHSLAAVFDHMFGHKNWNGKDPVYIAYFRPNDENITQSYGRTRGIVLPALSLYAVYGKGSYAVPLGWLKYDPTTGALEPYEV